MKMINKIKVGTNEYSIQPLLSDDINAEHFSGLRHSECYGINGVLHGLYIPRHGPASYLLPIYCDLDGPYIPISSNILSVLDGRLIAYWHPQGYDFLSIEADYQGMYLPIRSDILYASYGTIHLKNESSSSGLEANAEKGLFCKVDDSHNSVTLSNAESSYNIKLGIGDYGFYLTSTFTQKLE